MNETMVGYLSALGIFGVLISAWLYQVGGRAGTSKGIRRFGASFFAMLTVVLLSLAMGKFSWWLLLIYPLKIAEYVQGYSAEHGMPAYLKRLFIALTSVACGVLYCIVIGKGWWMIPLHISISFTSILFAIANPIDAPAEEAFIAVLSNITLAFYPFIV